MSFCIQIEIEGINDRIFASIDMKMPQIKCCEFLDRCKQFLGKVTHIFQHRLANKCMVINPIIVRVLQMKSNIFHLDILPNRNSKIKD